MTPSNDDAIQILFFKVFSFLSQGHLISEQSNLWPVDSVVNRWQVRMGF